MDTHFLSDPKIQEVGDEVGPAGIAVFVALLAQAKLRADGGRVEFTYRDLAHSIFTDLESAGVAVRALVSAGVLTVEESDDRSAVVKFPAWRRWNETFRKANQRAAQTA